VDADAYARWVLEPPRPTERAQPRESYFICATPRSGSWYLAGLLASTGVAGRPHEWFWRDTRASLERAWGVRDDAEYLELVLTAGSTPNGVFGAKVMFGSLPPLDPFPSPRLVWMRRRDRLAQARSFARAVQTGHWHHWDPAPRVTPERRDDMVEALAAELDELEAGWQRWFGDAGVEPLEVEYERLDADPSRETRRVLSFLGLPLDVQPRALTVRSPPA
jgi:trehalose 2-sulfotransferase